MKRFLPALIFPLLAAFPAHAQTPTWADDVAPIVYSNCTSCHNPNGIAPFSLLSYSDAVTNATDIQTDVTGGEMPPWPPDASYRRFAHERRLSATDIQKINDWVNGGTPQGNMANAPTPPTYSSAATMTNPDLTVQIPTYTHSSATDDYRCFVIQSNTSTNQYITQIEVLPGNRSIVHHVLIYQDQSNTCVNLDNNDPNPGYTSFGGVGSSSATLVAGWVPGQGIYTLPPNMGIQLQAGAKLILQIHYPGVSAAALDSTKVLFKLSSGPMRQVALVPVLNHINTMTDGPLVIPANQVMTFHEQTTVLANATLISVAPHMHLIGQSMKVWAITPGQDTIPIINIPHWDFHWQGAFAFPQLQFVPYGSQLYAEAVYDNTINNPDNPNSPPQLVTAGEATTDEMMLTYFAYANYQPGDENIIIDSAAATGYHGPSFDDIVHSPQLYDPFPVPMQDQASVHYFLPNAEKVTLELLDVRGRRVNAPLVGQDEQAGMHSVDFDLHSVPAGIYMLRLQAGDVVKTKKLVKE